MAERSNGEQPAAALILDPAGSDDLRAELLSLRQKLAEREARIAALEAASIQASQIRLVADALPFLITYIDARGRCLYSNRASEDWFADRGGLFGRLLGEALDPPSYQALQPHVEAALAGHFVEADAVLEGPGGRRDVRLEYVPDRRADGRVAGFYALVRDISGAKSAQQALVESEKRFRAMADCAPSPIWVTNRGGIEFANQAFSRIAGRAEEELTGEAWIRLIHPDDVGALLDARAAAWEARTPYVSIARFRRSDGEWRWMQIHCNPRRDEQGALIGYVGIATDLTEQKKAEAELRESEARFRAMADSAPAPVWVTDERGIEFANRALCDFTGLPVDQLLGRAWLSLAHPDDLAGVLALREAAWREQEAYEFECRFRRFDGEWRWLRASCKPRERGDRFSGFVGMAIDITESRRAEQELRDSEMLLRAMFDNAGVGIVLLDPERRIVRANAAFAATIGREGEPLEGEVFPDLPAGPGDGAGSEPGAGSFAVEQPMLRADGRPIWVRLTVSGVGQRVLAIVEDITERKQVAEALRDSEDRFRTLAENIPTLCWMGDTEGAIFWYNHRWYEYSGTTHEEMAGWGWASLHDPELLPEVTARWKHSIGSGEPFEMVFPLRRADGAFRRFLCRTVPLRDDKGRIVRWFGTATDIESEIELDSELRAEGRRLAALNRVGAALAGELELERLVQMVTDAGVELTGAQFGAFFHNVIGQDGGSYMLYSLSGVDRTAFDRFPMPRATAVFGPTFAGQGIVRSDDITKDPRYGRNAPHRGMPEGHLPVASYLAVPVISRSGEVMGGLFFGHSAAGRFTERHERLLEGIAGQASVAMDNARLFEAAQREIAQRSRAEEALRDLNASLEARIAAAIAEREQAEEALRHAQKMEAVGQLTGGIAHDFNNLLTVISGNLDMAARRIGSDGDARILRPLANAMTGAQRAATLTQRLLAFSRRQPLLPKTIEPNLLLSGMTELLHRTLGETIRVETRLAAGLPRIEVDPHQLESAILNLAVNARDAMPGGGRLTLETGIAELGPEDAQGADQILPGRYVSFSVRDTGTGMDALTRRRAIEPFFTTKDVGKGTGLGLSMVYGFVRQSGGHLRIDSRPGEGSCIHLFLPPVTGEAVTIETAEASTRTPRAKDEEVILVCEDDDDVRAYTVETLRELGYSVLKAADGAAMLKLVAQAETKIDLLFTDVVLPGGVSGATLAEQARAHRPDLKLLFTSGYARDAFDGGAPADWSADLLSKPFTVAQLAERIRERLDR